MEMAFKRAIARVATMKTRGCGLFLRNSHLKMVHFGGLGACLGAWASVAPEGRERAKRARVRRCSFVRGTR